jgi:hypothetical protein
MQNIPKLINILIVSFLISLLIGTVSGLIFKNSEYSYMKPREGRDERIILNKDQVFKGASPGLSYKYNWYNGYTDTFKIYQVSERKFISKERAALVTIISFCTLSLLLIFFTRKKE